MRSLVRLTIDSEVVETAGRVVRFRVRHEDATIATAGAHVLAALLTPACARVRGSSPHVISAQSRGKGIFDALVSVECDDDVSANVVRSASDVYAVIAALGIICPPARPR